MPSIYECYLEGTFPLDVIVDKAGADYMTQILARTFAGTFSRQEASIASLGAGAGVAPASLI